MVHTSWTTQLNSARFCGDKMKCKIDGSDLCITEDNFINLQESKAYFIPITPKQRNDLELIFGVKND